MEQILQYTEPGEEHQAIKSTHGITEKLLDHINETIREQEGREKLRKVSENLWIGQGYVIHLPSHRRIRLHHPRRRLDLTAPTRYMGTRRLLKEGHLSKTKSRRRIYAFLCSDILVLTDETMKTLYRMVRCSVHPTSDFSHFTLQ
jgi:hypothetical protein